MVILKIGTIDFSAELLEYSDERIQQTKNVRTNAVGDTSFTLVKPKYKIYCTFDCSSVDKRSDLLSAIEPYFLDITFRETKSQSLKTIRAYPGNAKNVYKLLNDEHILLDSVSINFIEL